MNLSGPYHSKKYSLLRYLFFALALLFVTNAVLPEWQKYMGDEITVIQENCETASEEEEKKVNKETDVNDFIHIYNFDALPYFSDNTLNATQNINWYTHHFDITTPPPQQA